MVTKLENNEQLQSHQIFQMRKRDELKNPQKQGSSFVIHTFSMLKTITSKIITLYYSTLPGVHFMKKKLLIIILSIMVLIIVGYFILNEFKKKHLINEAQEKAETY